MLRKAFIDELLMRGLLPGERTAEALAQVESPTFLAWVDKLGLDKDSVVAARCTFVALASLRPNNAPSTLAPRESAVWLRRSLYCSASRSTRSFARAMRSSRAASFGAYF